MKLSARGLNIQFFLWALMIFALAGCNNGGDPAKTLTSLCAVTEPEWVKPPEDSAVGNPPEFGHYYVNEDRSIWAAAWWTGIEKDYLRAGEERGIKTGWFRPAGEELIITGRRLDGQAPPLETSVPCCYPTRFQATGLIFPAEGCWEVTATAADRELSFIVQVEP